MATQSQWHTDSLSGRMTGLDYAAVRAAAQMMGYRDDEMNIIFEGLQVMEYAAQEAWNDG